MGNQQTKPTLETCKKFSEIVQNHEELALQGIRKYQDPTISADYFMQAVIGFVTYQLNK